MSSRLLRLAVFTIPIVLGLIITAWGISEFHEATVVFTPKSPSPYGILAFSSIQGEIVSPEVYIDDMHDLKENYIETFDLVFGLSVTSSSDNASSEEQIFGCQVPYNVELKGIEAKGWIEHETENVTFELVDPEVNVEEHFSLIYFRFVSSSDLENYEFRFCLSWKEALIKQTFSTYRLYVPIAQDYPSDFSEYFSNLNYTVHVLTFSQKVRVHMNLPTDCEVIDSIPPIESEEIHDFRRHHSEWSLSVEGCPFPSTHPSSEVVRVDFESREELARHNRLLFDSGLWLGIGISNIIGGTLASLRYILETRKPAITEQ